MSATKEAETRKKKPKRKNLKNISVRKAKSKKTGYPGLFREKALSMGGRQDTQPRACGSIRQLSPTASAWSAWSVGTRWMGIASGWNPGLPEGRGGGCSALGAGWGSWAPGPLRQQNSVGQLGGHCQGLPSAQACSSVRGLACGALHLLPVSHPVTGGAPPSLL